MESARPPPSLPPLSAQPSAAPARAARCRDAPALRRGTGRLRKSLRQGSGAAAGRSKRPKEGDAPCVRPAQLPPLEMNMSLPGRVSCSMLNCFVSAFFFFHSFLPPPPSFPPRLLHVCKQGGKPAHLSSPRAEPPAPDQACP